MHGVQSVAWEHEAAAVAGRASLDQELTAAAEETAADVGGVEHADPVTSKVRVREKFKVFQSHHSPSFTT